MIPSRNEPRLHLLVKTIVDRDLVGTSCGHQLLQMFDGVGFFETVGEEAIELAFGMEEVVVRIDDDNCCVSWHGDGFCVFWDLKGFQSKAGC